MPLPDIYKITRINKTDVTARSSSGHIVRRHLNHFQLANETNGTSSEPQHYDTDYDQVHDDYPYELHFRPQTGGNDETQPQPAQAAHPAPQRTLNRNVHFNPRVQVRGPPRTRSSGPAPDLPNVMTAPLERSAQARAEAERIIEEHEREQNQ